MTRNSRWLWTLPIAACLSLAPLLRAQPSAEKAPQATPTQPAAGAAPTPAAQGESQAERARRAQVLVRYDGGEVTVGELEDRIAEQSPFMRRRYRDRDELKRLLEKIVQFELMAAEAERRGFEKNDEVQQAVKQNAVQLLMRREFDEKMTPDVVAREQIEAYYKDNLREYVRPEMRRANMILLPTQKEAKALLPQAKGADLKGFRELARDKTQDEATRLRGGDLRYFDKQGERRDGEAAKVAEPIVRAVFKLKEVGDVAPVPVKVEGGYAIVKLTGLRQAMERKLDDVADTIRMRLWREQRKEAIDAFLSKLREAQKPELHPELLSLIKLQTPAAAGRGLPAGFPHTPPGTQAPPHTRPKAQAPAERAGDEPDDSDQPQGE